ncbi:aldehyde dehydrogenase, dimeric NADP-preferring-like [Dysidea avara]|uniref:aldehyde dehydrogenase, dimeric NADP-preferring-like n=1 Tax=Dysidea avara TaxID=196820 RepID=UPI00331965AF
MAALEEVDPSAVPEMVAKLRKAFNTGKTRPKQYRLHQLKCLLRMLEEKEDEIATAIYNDLRRSKEESMLGEFFSTKAELVTAINNLDEWMKPEYVKKDMTDMINSIYIQREPLGVVCVISSWNYPIVVLIQPVAAAIAAGNVVLLKPSDVSTHTSNLMMELIPQYLDPECYSVAAGGIPVAQAVLKEKFDHIIYTGSSGVGKIIMKAAAEHLTPVTLEMGGKSPCYVDSSANIKVAGKRIAWGKYLNAGQTCLAPDYVLCQKSVKDDLVASIKTAVKEFYGEDPRTSKSYARVINERHFTRVERLLKDGVTVMGGESDKDDLYIAPTLITDVKNDDAIMEDEIFGPILPIVTVDDLDGAIDYINGKEKPLVLYAFTTNKQVQKLLSTRTSSGGFTVNDVLVQFGVLTLPFGGVGNSGQGAYHGKFGFDTFSHKKACYITTSITEPLMSVRYPPFTTRNLKIASSLIVPKIKRRSYFRKAVMLCFIAVMVAFGLRRLGYSFF